jgi:hypothetical protein
MSSSYSLFAYERGLGQGDLADPSGYFNYILSD